MASGAGALGVLRGQCARDPEGYRQEFEAQVAHYRAAMAVAQLHPSRPSPDLLALLPFLAHLAPHYPKEVGSLSVDIMQLLDTHGAALEPEFRRTAAQALILLRGRQVVAPMTLLPLFFRLLRLPDKPLRQLLVRHIVTDIRNVNAKGRDERLNRALQNFLYGVVQAEDSHVAARKALGVLGELYRRKVWTDARTVNVIAAATFHPHPQPMIAALKFFLGHDERASSGGGNDTDDDSDDEPGHVAVQPSKQDLYKAYKKGTVSSKKRKQAKLQRAMNAVKRQSRREQGLGQQQPAFAALQLLHDPQVCCVKLMMMNVLSRVIGTHRLQLLNFYPFMQRYIQPHQQEVTLILAITAQACHDLVPPDVLEPLLKQLVNQFIHDRARPEVMTVGIKTTYEICARAPLVMTEELLQDLVMYKKSHDKGTSNAARALIALYRQVAPSMLEKKDRGRGADLAARPKQFGEAAPASGVAGVDLLNEQSAQPESLRSLKRKQAELLSSHKQETEAPVEIDPTQTFLSSEDFARIRELKEKAMLDSAMGKHGLKKLKGQAADHEHEAHRRPEELADRRIDPSNLLGSAHKKLNKEERLAMVRAGREDRPAFGAASARKKLKTGGKSNREKQKVKAMPLAAVREKQRGRAQGGRGGGKGKRGGRGGGAGRNKQQMGRKQARFNYK
eukprot:jgi/Chlat1/4162/Chrsp27S04233